MTDISDIQAELDMMAVALAEKGVITPEATFMLASGGRASIHIRGQYDQKVFGGSDYKGIAECDIDATIAATHAYIAAMPEPKTAVMHTYMRMAGELVDFGHENNVPAEYVDPVRTAQKAMADNLIGVSK